MDDDFYTFRGLDNLTYINENGKIVKGRAAFNGMVKQNFGTLDNFVTSVAKTSAIAASKFTLDNITKALRPSPYKRPKD